MRYIWLVLIVLLAGCSTQYYICSDGSQVLKASDCPVTQEEEVTSNTVITPAPQEKDTIINKKVSGKIEDLLNLHKKKIKNVEYSHNLGKPASSRISIKGDYMKVVYPTHYQHNRTNRLREIFMDNSKKIAIGTCIDKNYCSEDMGTVGVTLDYDKYKVKSMPLSIINSIGYVEDAGHVNFDNRELTVLRGEPENGKVREYWIDSYYGFLFKSRLLDTEGNLISEETFSKVAFNTLSESDVLLPENINTEEVLE